MSADAIHVEFLTGFGYSTQEIAFLDLVTAHSGYFVEDQFLEFTGQRKGRALREFREKLAVHKHATFHTYRNAVPVYHVFARKLYRAFDREAVRTRRKHALEYIQTRLVALDFVLANQSCQFLKGETDRVQFLAEKFSVHEEDLPCRAYVNPSNRKTIIRHFPDQFPMFCMQSSGSEECSTTFTFIDPGGLTVQPFVTHLSSYMPLFRRLKAFTLIYVAPSSRLFGEAETAFRQNVLGLDGGRRDDQILRYFEVRRAWERDERVLGADVLFLKDSRRRFAGSETETLYKEWTSASLSENQRPGFWRNTFDSSRVTFRTAIHGRSLSVFSGNMGEQLEFDTESSKGEPKVG